MTTAEEYNRNEAYKDRFKKNEAEIAALHKMIGDLAVQVGNLASIAGVPSQPRVDATNLRAFDLDDDAPLVPQLRELLAEAGLRQVGTIIVRPGPSMTLDELFKSLETPRPELTNEEKVFALLREFGQECYSNGVGASSLKNTTSAIMALFTPN